jgi:hypothetical protein
MMISRLSVVPESELVSIQIQELEGSVLSVHPLVTESPVVELVIVSVTMTVPVALRSGS